MEIEVQGKCNMPEWFLVLLAIVGIVLLGFFFSALEFFKGLTKFLIFGLLVFLLFLLANRILPAIDSGQPYGRNYPDGDFRVPRLDPNSDTSEYLRNLGEDIDEFVFGTSESYPGTTPRSGDFVYPIPGTEPDTGTSDSSTIAEQPASPSVQTQIESYPGSRDQTTGSPANSTTSPTTYRRPISGMW